MSTIVYTDGSAIHGTSRALARAGWGVFYGEGCKHNISSKLHGQVQTSYRAEVRALLHAIQTAGTPICVYVDCQGVVNTINKFVDSGYVVPTKLNETDLWERIFEVVKCAPKD